MTTRNSDGGWGLDADAASNTLDTALVLQALKAANYSDTAVIGQALNYLTSNQNPDGGWGFAPGNDSNTYVTSLVLRSLSAYNTVFINQTAINNASAFLVAHQNTDGGFGNSPSTVYETALSVMSLIGSGQGSTTALQGAMNYLTTSQLADGSWNDDPYSTALALEALASARPNLTASSLSFSNNMPQDGETITITATVSNIGLDSASGIVVRFYSGDPASGGVQIGADQTIPSLAAGSSAQASITDSFTGIGGKTVFVVADPDSLISEISKADNKTSGRLWVATDPDLAVFSEDLKPSTYVPASGTAFTLEYTVRNLGESAAGGFDVALYDGQPTGTPLQTAHISGLAGSEVRTGTMGVTLAGDGSHTLYLVADSGNVIAESSETNNTGTVTVNVGGVQAAADLAVLASDITITPSRPTAGETVQISATVRNIGIEAANNFALEIFDGAPEAGGTLLSSTTVSLAAGAAQTAVTSWAIPSGIHDVYVVADRPNAIVETNESNNRASVRVMTDMTDLTISANDLVFTPAHPVDGDAVVLSITSHNTGIKDTGPYTLGLYDGDPAQGGILLQSYAVSNTAGDGSTTVSYAFSAAPGTYRFYAVADTENVVTEMYEDNNTAIRSLKIKAPGEVLGPDLVPTKIDLTDVTTDPQSLTISGAAHVTFQNKGDDKITSDFDVAVFEDRDGDGKYTPGVDNLVGTSTFVTGATASIPAIWPEGAGMVDVPLSGTVTFLHSPLYAFVDANDAILEQDETNNILVSCKDCEVVPANPIQPVVKWRWNKNDLDLTFSPPLVANFIDSNNDGKIDDQDVPVIVFAANTGQVAQPHQIVGLRGDTADLVFDISDQSVELTQWPYIAVGDVDNDGFNEVIGLRKTNAGSPSGPGILVYDHFGNLKLDSRDLVAAYNADPTHTSVTYGDEAVPVIADIDNDGKPEIIVGPSVFNNDGTVKWTASRTNAAGYGAYVGDIATVADLDLDGKQEVLIGPTAYNSDGTVRWTNTSLGSGMSVVANFDDDPYPEIVYVDHPNGYTTGARINVLDHTGRIKWGPVTMQSLEPSSPHAGWGSVPVIADFDGDGSLEIGIQGWSKFFILNEKGTVKMTLPIPPSSTCGENNTAPTVFDLNGDGIPEVIIDSGGSFQVYNGKTGALLYQDAEADCKWTPHTNYQRTIVSDVDGDGHAEIVALDWLRGFGGNSDDMVRVYGAQNNDWVGARKIWNQASYHITNVNDDGSIPQYESPSWLLNNSYHVQAAIPPVTNPYLTPNLTASALQAVQNGSSVDLTVRIGNGGAKEAASGIPVTFYDGDPASGGVVIGTVSTTRTLAPGEYQDLIYSWPAGTLGLHHIYAVVDAANSISECRKDDNTATVDITVAEGLSDLKIGSEDIVLSPSPVTEGSIAQITATVHNIGTVSASNVIVKLASGNPASGGSWIGLPQTIGSLGPGGTAQAIFSYDTLGHAGQNVLYLVLDPDNAVSESNKTNNIASIAFDVQQPQLPNLTIAPEGILFSPSAPGEGDKVTVTATVTNRGASVGNIPVQMSVGGQVLGTTTLYPSLGLGQSTTAQFLLDTVGLPGQQNVSITVDPANTIAESSKTDNSASAPLFVQSAGLSASVALDKASYQANDTVTATITLTNSTAVSRMLTVGANVIDSPGNLIAAVSSDAVTVGPTQAVSITRTWNTGKTLAGNYSVVAEVSENSTTISRANASFAVAPDKTVAAGVTVDKVSYNPNDTATLTATVTSRSANYIMENLTAVMKVTDQQSAVLFSATRALGNLMPGASFTFKGYWNTGTMAPGAYPVSLEVKDTAGTTVASASQTLTITNVVDPSTALTGQVSVDTQRLLVGDPVNVSYSVQNKGNVDLQNVALSVLTVAVSDQTVYNTISNQVTLAMGGSYANTGQIDTSTYTARDYLVVLRATIGGVTATIGGTYFRIEGAPTAPSLAGPAGGSDVLTFTPTLTVNDSSDPNDDKLSYEFEVYSDSGLANLVTSSSGTVAEQTGTTAWTVPVSLVENQTYYWRCRAYDGWLYGPWMETASFRVNTVNDPPTAPTVAAPLDGSSVAVLTPLLTVNNASDPDSPSLTYNFDVAADPGFTQIVASTTGVASGQGTTSWQVAGGLSENTWYYWRAQADDWLDTGPWSMTTKFFVNTQNDPPTTPTIIQPTDGQIVADLSADIVIADSTDPDSPVISYYFEVDTVPTFDSAGIIRSGAVPEGQGTTTWHVTGLKEDTQYYVRVKASDGQAESPWSNVVGVFVNAVNEPPTAPALANPSNGAGVTVFTPTLSVQDATDPDRDVLTYEFEVYSDSGLMNLVAQAAGIAGTAQVTSWTVPVALVENQTYYWRCRASDGTLSGPWMPEASFMVNTADDAPGAPTVLLPSDGSTVDTAQPTLTVSNATDPDSDNLTYGFEVYNGSTLVWSTAAVAEGASGSTSATVGATLADNTAYQWRARAFDGQLYGPWTPNAGFTVHLPQTGITVNLEIEPETLNQKSEGNWVMAEIELPHGYKASDVDVSSIRLEGTVPAVLAPTEKGKRHHEHGCEEDRSAHDHSELKVKFKRSDVIAVLPAGDKVPVHVTGTVAGTGFEGVDLIRVIH